MKPATPSPILTIAIMVLALAAAPAGRAATSAAAPAPNPAAPAPVDPPANAEELAKITYIIEPTDQLALTVDGQSDLNLNGTVRADGTFTVVYLTEPIKLAGLTIDEAQKRIEKAYMDGHILRNPKVRLNVTDPKKRQVIIEGHVKSPAHYNIPIETSMTVLDLVSQAGGFDDYATGEVTITHTDRDGKAETRKIDVDSILKGKRGAMKIDDPRLLIYPGDLVYAPESLF